MANGAASAEGGNTLVVGATGFIGRFVAEASLDSGWPTYLLVRSESMSSAKAAAVRELEQKGGIVVQGSFADKEFMEKTLKDHKIEIVICVSGGNNILDQLILIEAMKATRTIKRFMPSEFGHDIDKANPVEPGLAFYNLKREVRRATEAAGIPYTYVCCNSIAGWPYHDNIHPSDVTPPLDQFLVYGDGNVGAYFVSGNDIGNVTIRAAHDERTVNKTVHFRPACNFYSINKMAALWEGKIGRALPRVQMSESDLLDVAAENKIPESIVAALTHDIFINGCQINFSIDGVGDVEASSLYPDIKFETLDHCFDDYAAELLPHQREEQEQEQEQEEEKMNRKIDAATQRRATVIV